MGASGAGKTTMAGLVAGVRLPETGSVALSGVALERLAPAATRRAVVLVTQDVHVFAGQLRDDLLRAAWSDHRPPP